MASETKTKQEQAMAADDATLVPPADEPRGSGGGGGERPPERAATGGGFFSIYKKGQGYWTRMGTAIGAGLIGFLVTWQIYAQVPRFFADTVRGQKVALVIAGVFAAVYAFFAWRLMNKPAHVDFLIATDSEMKKVNWTSKRELIGSTKVVILFMFAIAIILFVLDLLFNTVFYSIRVLNIPWWKQIFGQ
jgi:preprotein translocase subunit SecE